MQCVSVIELAGLLLAKWVQRSSGSKENNICPFSKQVDNNNAVLVPEIALGGLLAARKNLIQNQLIQRGFLLGSCVVCDNEEEVGDFHQSVGLSPTLITKLACTCNLPLIAHDLYDAKQRLFLAQEALKIIDRCGIKYKTHHLLHRRQALHEVVSNRSIVDINNYFGEAVAIFFTWLKFLSVSLTLPSFAGLFVYAYQQFTGKYDDWYTPLYFCGVILWNIVFVKYWRQHISISKFSWGQEDQFISVCDPPKMKKNLENKVESNLSWGFKLVLYWVGCCLFCFFFLMTVPLTIGTYLYIMKNADFINDVLLFRVNKVVQFFTFSYWTVDYSSIGLLIYSIFLIIGEYIGRIIICPLFTRLLFDNASACVTEGTPAGTYVDIAFTLVFRFAILLYLCLQEQNILQVRKLLSLRVFADHLYLMYCGRLQKAQLRSFRVPTSALNAKQTAKYNVVQPSPLKKLFKQISGEDDPFWSPANKSHSDNSEEHEATSEITDVSNSSRKKKRLHVKNFTRAVDKVVGFVWGSKSHSSSQKSEESDVEKNHDPPKKYQRRGSRRLSNIFLKLTSNSVDSNEYESEEEVLDSDIAVEEWKPPMQLNVDSNDAKLLMEDVYAPVYRIEMGHASKIYCFGFVAIFSGIYPLAPLIAIAHCATLYNLDLRSIYSSRRPLITYMRNVKALFAYLKEWVLFIECLCFISIVVNCYLAFVVSPNGHLYIPDVIFGEDTTGAKWFTVVLEHYCLLVYILFNLLIADIPAWVMKGVNDVKNKESKKMAAERRLLYELQNPHNTSKENLQKILLLKQTLNIEEEQDVPTDIKSIAATKIATLYNSCGWALNPFVYLGLTVIPTILHYFYEPLYHFSIPILFSFAYYVHALHERRINAAVMGMTSDPEILRLLLKDLPDWVRESDRHQCEWMNAMAEQCMHMCPIFEIKLQKKLNETLDRIKPAFVTGICMEIISFGTIPPNIISMKILPAMPGSRTITADVEFSYTGNFRMIMDVLLLGQSMKLDFFDLRLRGTARVQFEPSDLAPEIAASQPSFKPFKKINISFMKKPHVDISFSLGETDGKKLKPAARGFESNLGQTVKHMIATKALYPKSIQINLDKETSTGESYSIANPIGVLQVQILSGHDLEIGDITTSDPFVEVRYADEIEKTAVIFKTLNPVWSNEVFEFLVFNEDMTDVQLIVYDYDLTSSPDFLGNTKFEFSVGKSGEVEHLDLPLKGVSTGHLSVAVTYYALQEPEVKKKDIDELLSSLPNEIIVDDIINPEHAIPLVDASSGYKEMQLFQDSKGNRFQLHKKRGVAILEDFVKKNMGVETSPVNFSQSSIIGVLMISRIACKDLHPPVSGRGLSLSSFCPYLQFNVNGLKRRTKSTRGTINPTFFDEYKAFILRDNDDGDLHLIIKLKTRRSLQKDTTISALSFSIKKSQIKSGQDMYIDQAFENSEGKEEGRLCCNLKIISART